MKKLLPVLIMLLLCTSFSCASAKTITGSETFTGFPYEKTAPYQHEGEHFILNTGTANLYTIPFGASAYPFSIESKDSAIIDSVEVNVPKLFSNWSKTEFDHGTKREESLSAPAVAHIDNVNSASFRAAGSRYVSIDSITIHYHSEVPDPPDTGDTSNLMLWLTFALAGTAGIVALTVRERREFR